MRKPYALLPGLALAIAALTGVFTSGCGANNRQVQHAVVRRRAPMEFNCPAQNLDIRHLNGDLWMVHGCGLKAIYNANGMCSDQDNCEPKLESGPIAEGLPMPPARQ